jgi:hypothetical protein
MSDDIIILTFSIMGILAGLIGLIYLGYKNNFISFLKTPHWVSLVILIAAGMMTWVAMVWIVNPNFNVTNKQWISFGFSIAISFLWWLRYVYTVSETADEDDVAP